MLARRAYRVWGLAAAAWCVAFGLLSLYWAAGGTLGVDQLAVSLQERADEREAGFVADRRRHGDRKAPGRDRAASACLPPPLPDAAQDTAVPLLGRRNVPGLVRAHRRGRGFDPRGPRHDGKRDLVPGAMGPDLAARRAAVSDDGLDYAPRCSGVEPVDEPQLACACAAEVGDSV